MQSEFVSTIVVRHDKPHNNVNLPGEQMNNDKNIPVRKYVRNNNGVRMAITRSKILLRIFIINDVTGIVKTWYKYISSARASWQQYKPILHFRNWQY